MSTRIEYLTPERLAQEAPIWIDPVGGFGDILMLSTALKKAHELTARSFTSVDGLITHNFSLGTRPLQKSVTRRKMQILSAMIIGVGLTLTTSIVKLYLSYSRFLR